MEDDRSLLPLPGSSVLDLLDLALLAVVVRMDVLGLPRRGFPGWAAISVPGAESNRNEWVSKMGWTKEEERGKKRGTDISSTSSRVSPLVSGTMKYTQTIPKRRTPPKMRRMRGPIFAATGVREVGRRCKSQRGAERGHETREGERCTYSSVRRTTR